MTSHESVPTAVTPLGHYYNGMTKYANMMPLEDCINQHERSGWTAAWQADCDFIVDDGRTYLERAADEADEWRGVPTPDEDSQDEGRQYHNFCGPNHA